MEFSEVEHKLLEQMASRRTNISRTIYTKQLLRSLETIYKNMTVQLA